MRGENKMKISYIIRSLLSLSLIVILFCPAVFAAGEADISIEKMDVITPESLKSNELPGQTETILPGDIFGTKSGYFHPFLSLTGKYSDNIYRERDDTISDFSVVISPGIWIAVPGSDKIILSVSSSTAQPGGLSTFLEKPEAFSRYQSYAFYGADIERFTKESDRNNIKQTANGFFQYNLRGGLSFNVYDKWIDSEDPLRYSEFIVADEYVSNLLGFIIDYNISEKFNLRLDLNNFYLSYNEDFNQFKDRTDNGLSLYGFYIYSPKTSLFAEYNIVDVNLDQETSPDSLQNSFYLGTIWNPTEATQLTGKLGYSQKDFSDEGKDSVDGFSFELKANHNFTEKTSISLFGAQKIYETKIPNTDYQNMRTLTATLTQKLTDKITCNLGLDYTENDYKSTTASGNDRDDTVYNIEPGIQYMIKRWLMLRAWYAYTDRDSSDDFFDYKENAFYLSISGGM